MKNLISIENVYLKIAFFQVTIALIIITVASAVADHPTPSYKQPEYSDHAIYSYSWSVNDQYSSNNFGQHETRNGANTSGSYYVQLPDGRLQKVSYSVDGYGGKH